jgi:1,4-dihydroxy-2-naphthoyl-CoA hydrolase
MLHRGRSVIGYAASVPDETGLATPSLHQLMPFARTLGIELLAATPDQVHCRLRWSEGLEGAGVGLHGGAIMGLADTGGGICAALNLPAGATGTTTIESKTNFLRAIRSGTIEAVSRPSTNDWARRLGHDYFTRSSTTTPGWPTGSCSTTRRRTP